MANIAVMMWLIFAVTATVVITSNASFPRYPGLDKLGRHASADVQRRAAEGVIQRTLPRGAADFIVQIDPSLEPANRQTFRLLSNGSHVTILSRTGIGATWGFHYFLTQYCGAQVTWADKQLALPDFYPVITLPGVTVVSNDRFNYYENVCTSSYSYVWWDWSRWQKELDWMALRGINLPLAFNAQEAIWQRVYLDLGFTQNDLDEFFGGPGYLAWSRMGNIHGWGGPIPDSWMTQQVALQHKILSHMTALGMIPVTPAFAGHVPQNFNSLFPKANVTKLGAWSHFNCTYSCTYLLDPTDPMFQTIGKKFLDEYKSEFGVSHIYSADTFNEMTPKSNDTSYIRQCAIGVYKAMTAADPDAIWLMQGWMFHDQFWSADLVEALVTSLPEGQLIVLDLSAEVDDFYHKFNSFYGQPFIWGMLQNFGGTNDLSGTIANVNTRPFEARDMADSSMVGTGMNPEGIHENEIMFEFMNENTWRQEPRNLTEWVDNFVSRRYHANETYTKQAWQLLKRSVYNASLAIHRGKNPLVKRPRLNSTMDIWYQIEDVYEAYELMCHASYNNDLRNNTYFRYDYISVLGQVVHCMVHLQLMQVDAAYERSDISTVSELGFQILGVLANFDNILNFDERFLLGVWLESAKSRGTTEAERKLYEYNARTQITLWGPNGEILDYAAKLWGGLVKDYYYPRWRLFFTQLTAAMEKGVPFKQKQFNFDVFHKVEKPFTLSNKIYPTKPNNGDVFECLRSFMHKYRGLMTQQIKYIKLHRNSHNIDTVGINVIEKSTGKSNVKFTVHGQKL